MYLLMPPRPIIRCGPMWRAPSIGFMGFVPMVISILMREYTYLGTEREASRDGICMARYIPVTHVVSKELPPEYAKRVVYCPHLTLLKRAVASANAGPSGYHRAKRQKEAVPMKQQIVHSDPEIQGGCRYSAAPVSR